MNMRLCAFSSLGLLVCIVCTGLEPNAALCGQKDAKDAKDSIAGLFDGIPADLRSKVKANSVRRDRVNDWLSDHVNGKGKTVEIQLPVRVTATRAKEATYTIVVIVSASGKKRGFGGGGQFPGFGGGSGGAKVAVLGDEWPVGLGFATKDSAEIAYQLELEGVNTADAEKMVELEWATFKGNVKLARIYETSFGIILDDVQVDGKKMTPKNLSKGKGKAGPAPNKGGA